MSGHESDPRTRTAASKLTRHADTLEPTTYTDEKSHRGGESTRTHVAIPAARCARPPLQRSLFLRTPTVLNALADLRRRTQANDKGAETLELVIMTPVVLLLIALIIVGGLVSMAHHKVEHAAAEASRSASLSRTVFEASSSAQDAATSDLAAKGLSCVNLSISTDTSGFRTRPGVTATVETTVTCDVALDSLGLFGISGVRTIKHTSTSPIDTYRERSR